MKVSDCDRYGCTMGKRRIQYTQLRRYVCEACGGQAVHRFGVGGDEVICGAGCGGQEFIHEETYAQQSAEGFEVLRGLPEHLRALMKGDDECLSATEAVADLFD